MEKNLFVRNWSIRKFCVPYFWTSENYHQEMIKNRTIEYLVRTIYWLDNLKPRTLEKHLEQEIFVASKINYNNHKIEDLNLKEIETFYLKHKE